MVSYVQLDMKFTAPAAIHTDLLAEHGVHRRVLTRADETVGAESAAFSTANHPQRPLLGVNLCMAPQKSFSRL